MNYQKLKNSNLFPFVKKILDTSKMKYSKPITKHLFSKKSIITMLGVTGLIQYKKYNNLEESTDTEFEKNLYKDKSFTKLYKHTEDFENFGMIITQLKLSKEHLQKKMNTLANKKVVDFKHNYNIDSINSTELLLPNENFNSEKNSKSKHFIKKMNLLYNNFKNSNQISKKVKNAKKECKKIEFLLRNIINSLENQIFYLDKSEKLDNCRDKFDLNVLGKIKTNELIDVIKEIDKIKNNSIFSSLDENWIENFTSEQDKIIFYNVIFNEYEEIRLRLLSNLAIFHHFGLENLTFNQENQQFAFDLCKNIISDNKSNKNESLIYYAKNFFINYMNNYKDSKELYFYSDYIMEINQSKNFQNFIHPNMVNIISNRQEISFSQLNKEDKKEFNKNKIQPVQKDFDFDLIFICGLNANFAKSWRIPDKPDYYNSRDIINFYLKGENVKKLFPVKNYQLWIPRMMEAKSFKNQNIRYIVSVGETKFFKLEHMISNIPDLSIYELSNRIYKSLCFANVGERPFILICHSMGGLIAKNMIKIAEKNNDSRFINNNKGIVFFSTPHLGSNIINSIISSAVNNYVKFLNVVNHTVADHGFENHDLKQKIGEFQFAKACTEVCFNDKEEFVKLHEDFKKFNLDYINFVETDKLFIRQIGERVHVVEPESAYLAETQNFILKNKNHANLQKFSPDNMEDFGYFKLIEYINIRLNLQIKILDKDIIF